MGGPTRQRQAVSTSEPHSEQSNSEQNTDTIDPSEVDPEEIVKTADGELMHEPTGLILEDEQIDHGPEWRSFTQTERDKKSRVGAPMTEMLHDRGLTTTIGWQNKDAYGRSISSEKRTKMHRLRKWQKRIRTQDASERNLKHALGEIDRMAAALGVPDATREMASVIYRRALNEDLLRGRSIEAVATAALYAACRQENIPRSLSEVTPVSRVNRKEVGRTYRYISNQLGLEIEPADPKQYVPRFASKLDVSAKVQQKAKEVIDVSAEAGLLSGKSPTGFAAAAIYAASLLCNDKVTQRKVADAANVTEVTVRSRYQEQLEAMGLEM
jgi:Transcription initiation factor IIB (TFIIB)